MTSDSSLMMDDTAVAIDADRCHSSFKVKARLSNWRKHPDSIDLDQPALV